MEFSTPSHIAKLAEKTRSFITEKVIPFESDPRWTGHGPTEELRKELTDIGRDSGLFAPHAPKEFGGLGLGHLERAFVFEEAGYSLLGPTALHCGAPDEGNTHLLDVAANPAQREQFLAPLANGARSCFAMTEPDGAGADPPCWRRQRELMGTAMSSMVENGSLPAPRVRISSSSWHGLRRVGRWRGDHVYCAK